MAEISIAAGSVAAIVSPAANQIATVTARGIAGGTIVPGQVLYADPSANNQLKPAQATNALQASNVVGIALGSANPNQPVTYAIGGDVQLQSASAPLVASGSVYVLAAGTAGNIVSTNDGAAPAAGSGNFSSIIGIGNAPAVSGTTNVLRLVVMPAAVRL